MIDDGNDNDADDSCNYISIRYFNYNHYHHDNHYINIIKL